MKTLVLHVTHVLNDNTRTFIERGLIHNSTTDFIFIFNGSPNLDDYAFIHTHDNMHLFVRPNVGQDFQGWNEALFLPAHSLSQKVIYHDSLTPSDTPLYQLYHSFVCVNSTVAGPYLPLYVDSDWVTIFTAKLSDEVKMVGIGINGMSNGAHTVTFDYILEAYEIYTSDLTHMQSMIFAVDREGMTLLMEHGLFREGKQFPKDKWELITKSEIAMGVILRRHGKSLYSFLQGQGTVTATDRLLTDNMWYNTPHPLFETIFVKTNIPSGVPKEKAFYDACGRRQQKR
jgi:hypothetical protein